VALFQKKPQVNSIAPLYTVGANQTSLIIGLGNPEKKYDGTRHNIGFAALEHFAAANEFPGWVNKKDLKCHVTSNNLGGTRVILCMPTTFMNHSGEAAQLIQHFYQVYNKDTLVVYDELAMAFGQIRARVGGSDAGHNGIKSLIQYIGEDFGRLRIGIGSKLAEKADAADFVLGKFSKTEQATVPLILKEASAMLTEYVFSDELPHETRSVI
jgi:PTH1 family peptidyl-tRNA hydrolase